MVREITEYKKSAITSCALCCSKKLRGYAFGQLLDLLPDKTEFFV